MIQYSREGLEKRNLDGIVDITRKNIILQVKLYHHVPVHWPCDGSTTLIFLSIGKIDDNLGFKGLLSIDIKVDLDLFNFILIIPWFHHSAIKVIFAHLNANFTFIISETFAFP